MRKRCTLCVAGTSGRWRRLSLIWPATYSFNIILALSYIVVGIILQCKPTPVPGLLNLGSKKKKGSFAYLNSVTTHVWRLGGLDLELGPYLGTQPLLVSEALHAVTVNADSYELRDGNNN